MFAVSRQRCQSFVERLNVSGCLI
uniref:Uncharacterized protein n=1 Tax=Anguilla anguilla TaxID=7936 RepID=A0A0E9WA01_ANGAN